MSNEKQDALTVPSQSQQAVEVFRGSARQTRLAAFTPANLTEAIALAKMMAASEMVPNCYRKKPADILVAIQFGSEVGLAPMQSLQSISVINGHPALWGDGALALVQGHPDFEDIIETTTGTVATCIVKRRGRTPVTRTFSDEDAQRAQLLGKGPWTQYRFRMRQMRARGFALRDSFADVLKGISIAEEAMDIPTDTSGAKQQREAMAFDVQNLQPSSEPNRGHDDTGLERKNGKVIDAKPDQAPAKEAPAMCGNCGLIGKHAPDCKYATQDDKTSKPMNKAMYLIEAAEKKVSKKQGDYVVLTVMGQDGTKGKLYVWDKKIHQPFLEQDYSTPVPAIMEVSEKETPDKKKFVEVEHLIELGAQKFVNDQPAESGMAEEVGESLFGSEEL